MPEQKQCCHPALPRGRRVHIKLTTNGTGPGCSTDAKFGPDKVAPEILHQLLDGNSPPIRFPQ